MGENEVGARCKDCNVVLIDEQHVVRVHPYVIDGDSVCLACRDKRMMIARRYGKPIEAGEVHPKVKEAVAEANAKKEEPVKEEASEKKPVKKAVKRKGKK